MQPTDRRDFLRQAGAVTAALAAGGSRAAADERADRVSGEQMPPHRAEHLPGLFAYADRESVPAGGTVGFHVSSSVPYRYCVCRLGASLDDPASDEVLSPVEQAPACPQPVHPGSYVHVEKGLAANERLDSLGLECWVRPWAATGGWRGLVTQDDQPQRCGWGLFIDPQGRLAFYLGDGKARREQWLVTSEPAVLSRGQWHHVVAGFDGQAATLWLNGELLVSGPVRQVVRNAAAPLRLGALGHEGLADGFLDGDLAMIAIYDHAPSGAMIEDRRRQQGLQSPSGNDVLACWAFAEERGSLVADVSAHRRDGRIINHGTWMIGGPSFDADVDRYGRYDPQSDPRRGHGLRLAGDDLYDCRWRQVHQFTVPAGARPGQFAARFEYTLDGKSLVTHAAFLVTRRRGQPAAPVLLLNSTNTWRAYNATPFAITTPGLKTYWGTRGAANSPGEPPAYCMYRGHAAGQGTYQVGLRIPWRGADPYLLYGRESDYSHLARADRCTQLWLERGGYEFDVVGDLDLHRDAALLDGYRVLVISGHSEYWSIEAYRAVEQFLASGGNVICLSGNTMFWRVTFDDEAAVMECRKVDAPGNQMPPAYRGECWHSHDGRRGGLLRDCGLPAWRLLGLETLGWFGTTPEMFGPFRAAAPDHFLFQRPRRVELRPGELFGQGPDGQLPRAGGHEIDVRLSTLRKLCRQEPPHGAEHPDEPQGIVTLANGLHDWQQLKGTSLDYFTRVELPDDDQAAELIYWERPDGGRVLNTGSIASSWTMLSDPRLSALVANALDHFLGT